jgi:hypothetical protein
MVTSYLIRAAFYTQDKTPVDAEYRTDEIMSYILDQTLLFPDPSDYQVFLLGRIIFDLTLPRLHHTKVIGATNLNLFT